MLIIGRVSDLKRNDDFLMEPYEHGAMTGHFFKFVEKDADLTDEIVTYMESAHLSMGNVYSGKNHNVTPLTLVIYHDERGKMNHGFVDATLPAAIRRSI